MTYLRAVGLLVGVLALAACAGGSQNAIPSMRGDASLATLAATGAGKITHVVYIIQENRSFDNLFQGYPGANTVAQGKSSDGYEIPLKSVGLSAIYEIDHTAEAMFAACDGAGKLPGTKCRMDAFDREFQWGGPRNGQYVYVPHSESKPYFDMAHEWVLADDMFQSQLDESFVAHQYTIAAQAASAVDLPNRKWGCGGAKDDYVETIAAGRKIPGPRESPCFDYRTLGDELDKANLSWRFYTSKYDSPSSGDGYPWSAFTAIRHVYYGADWKKVVTPQYRFINDVRDGTLSNFTWITPECYDSDHVNCGGGYGPSWVAALVNTVGKSKYWKSTAIFVQWDDWGGLYDHVAPPYAGPDGLGFRVPLLVISPYAKRGHVSHVQYETASVLRFAEDLFGLGQLAAADRRARSPATDCFDFSQNPRPFRAIAAPQPPRFFFHQHDLRPPDEE
jgi:phospholipase C